MEMKFDPMTGEPIQTESEPKAPEMKFDPMTGQPIQIESEPKAPEMKFDPMTGQPVQVESQPTQPQMKFDPMTGQPIQIESEPKAPEMKFDPMTGQPIQMESQPEQPQMKFDPMTGQPIQAQEQPVQPQAAAPGYNNVPGGKKKKGKFAVAMGIVVALVLVCGVAFAGVKSGLFLSKSGKVALATSNTFSETSHLTKSLQGLDILATKNYTMDVDVDISGEGRISASYANTSSEKQISGSVRIQDAGSIDFIAAIDAEEVKAQIPTLGDDVYVYNYTKEKKGYLADQLDQDDIDGIDEICKTIYSNKEQKKQGKEIAKIFADQYKELKFKSASKQTFEVNGKDRSCKGYQTTVTSDDMINLMDKLEDYTRDQVGDVLDDQLDVRDMFDEYRDMVEDMSDMDMTFYIYKNKLACVELEAEGDDVQLIFHGGDTRTQNMELLYNDKTQFEIKGETSGKVEESRIYVDGTKIATLSYDYGNGEYELDLGGSYTVDGTLKSDRKGFTFTCDADEISVEVNLSKGVDLEKISGDTIDIGNASESELEDLWMKYLDMSYEL